MIVGYTAESYWAQTPRTILLATRADRRRKLREANARIALAWNIAALQRHRKLPDIKRLYWKEPQPKQSWQEQLAIAERWAATAAKQAKLKEKVNGR